MPGIFRRPQEHQHRYYIYISQAKLDILIPQMPARVLRSLEAEIRIDIGVLAAGIKKSATDLSPELAARAVIVGDYLEKRSGMIGTLASPGPFVKDMATLRYGVMRDYAASLVVFASVADGMKLALIGSPASLIGAAADAEANHSLNYYTVKFLRAYPHPAHQRDRAEYDRAVDHALAADVLPPTSQRLEFLAKVLYCSDGTLVATPIYVATRG